VLCAFAPIVTLLACLLTIVNVLVILKANDLMKRARELRDETRAARRTSPIGRG
jgi:hypothetical protein